MRDFRDAVQAGIITADQAEQLGRFFAELAPAATSAGSSPAPPARFDLAHLLWYAGALLIMGAMGAFTTIAFAALGATALLVIALGYAASFAYAGRRLWHRQGLQVPGGLLIAVAVSMAPLATWSFQETMGWWAGGDQPGDVRDFYHWIRGGFIPMELATIAAALLARRHYRFPFLLFLAAVAVWFLSMDVADWLRGNERMDWALRRNVSLAFGLVLVPLAWAIDLRGRQTDDGFWLHLVGAVTFWCGLTFQDSGSELGRFVYFLINLGLLGLAVFLSRRVYAVFGAIGVMVYLWYLAGEVFRDFVSFPVALTVLGVAIIWLGILYQRNAASIEAALLARLPGWLLRLRPVP
jgi:hypothetical protein